MRVKKTTLRWIGTAIALAIVLPACDGDMPMNDAGNTQDTGNGSDVVVSPCGATGPYGTYTGVNGGQSGVMACGQTFTSFSGATVTIAQGDGGMALLTVTGTGTVGDTVNCPATVTECDVAASACPTGGGSTISYDLHTFTHQFSGTAHPSVPGPGGGCQFTYSIDGSR